MIPMPYRVRKTKSTTRSSTSSIEGQLSGAWPNSSRASSSQSLTSGEKARESPPRTSCNSFSRSSHRSSIYKTPKIQRNFKNYNFWSINQMRSIQKINPSKSRMLYKKLLKTHSSHTKTQLSWPPSQSQMKKRKHWSTTHASRTSSSKPTSSAITCSNSKTLKASLSQWAIQRKGKLPWPHTKYWNTPLPFCRLSWVIISKRKISSQW